jgi:hypothetical protein
MSRTLIATALLTVLVCGAAKAHEYWISPETYQVPAGADILADLRNGQQFVGVRLPYLPDSYRRFEVIEGDTVTPVTGRLGDLPALSFEPTREGLAILVLETTENRLTYTEFEKFSAFTEHKDFTWALAEHAARGLPETGFRESYVRLVKALVAVGGGVGQDRVTGLRTEIVAEANPYTEDVSAGLPLRVLFDDAPRADAQVELFAKAPDGTVEVTLHRTDAEGRVTVPVAPGHEYFADAVVLLDTGNDDITAGPVWHSLWAGLSFAVP